MFNGAGVNLNLFFDATTDRSKDLSFAQMLGPVFQLVNGLLSTFWGVSSLIRSPKKSKKISCDV
jgi:hypothetical protein